MPPLGKLVANDPSLTTLVDAFNQMAGRIDATTQFRVAPPLKCVRNGDGLTISIDMPTIRRVVRFVVKAPIASQGGRYDGRILLESPGIKNNATGNLAQTDYQQTGWDPGVNDCVIWNMPETGGGGHCLPKDKVFFGWIYGTNVSTSGGTSVQKPIILCDIVYHAFFPVLVKSVGGSDGTQTTRATWTYDLYPLGDTSYANKINTTALQPLRSAARITYGGVTKPTDGSIGMAVYDNSGSIQLWDLQELGTSNSCS